MNREDYIVPTGQLHSFEYKPCYDIKFHRDGKTIGALDFNGPALVFTGDAEESAKVFIDWLATTFHGRLEQERAAERNKLAAWMMAQGYATGHGDTMEDLLAELDWQVKERVGAEREACAKVCEGMGHWVDAKVTAAAAIRARGQA